ncbi:MAG: glycine cleavage T C-terminal barrel domain-containing protein, partial [Pseudomonadota bacterium]
VNGEELLSLSGQEVGVVNSPCYSHRLGKSLALGHVQPDAAAAGTTLVVNGGDIDTTATIVDIPVYDPQKSKTHG